MAKKITKKERKKLDGPNLAVMMSLRDGAQGAEGMGVGEGYTGSTPAYTTVNMGVVKVRPGVPFVKHERWVKC